MIQTESGIIIRPARLDDASCIVEFNRNLAKETENVDLDRETTRRGVEAVLNDPSKGQYWIAEIEGRIAGQTQITYEWSDWRNGYWWWIQSVYTNSAFRRRGVYRALYAHIKRLARETENVIGLRLYVDRDNHAAQSTYIDLGMIESHYRFFESPFNE